MDAIELHKSVSQAQKGNEALRDELIRRYKPFILNTVGHICGRYVTWNDEEASIGLLAFNRAIDTYHPGRGRTFLNYAYLLIQRDLTDHFRKEQNRRHVSIHHHADQQNRTLSSLANQSIQQYLWNVQKTELVEEILEFREVLNQFHISFEQLESQSPRHRDTRERVFQMAEQFIQDRELVQLLFKNKRLPISRFAEKTGYHRKTIEKHRNYLITLIILKLNPQWIHLSQYIKAPAEMEVHQVATHRGYRG
jgi:RNA polymerase sigma factor